jgi:hypothetical protein
MMMTLEDLRLALRQICQAMGLPGNVAAVVSLIVLGVALNVTAFRAVEFLGIGRHACQDRTVLRTAAQTELKVVRTVVISTLKRVGAGGRRWCLARQLRIDQQPDGTGYRVQVGVDWAAPADGEGCDVMNASSFARKTAIAYVQC